MKNEKDARLLSIAFGLIVLSTVLVMLALFTLTGKAQVDDGYPAPTDDISYPIYWYVYPDPSYPAPIDYGYPIGYPVIEPYPVEYGYPVDVDYPVFEPYPIDDGYPAVEVVSEPETVQVESEVYSNPVHYEPKSPYREGRNLWQEIVYQFAKLLALMK